MSRKYTVRTLLVDFKEFDYGGTADATIALDLPCFDLGEKLVQVTTTFIPAGLDTDTKPQVLYTFFYLQEEY